MHEVNDEHKTLSIVSPRPFLVLHYIVYRYKFPLDESVKQLIILIFETYAELEAREDYNGESIGAFIR